MQLDAIDKALYDEMIDHLSRNNLNGAKRLFANALETAIHIPTFAAIFKFIPAVYVHFERTQAWARLYVQLGKKSQKANSAELQQVCSLKMATKLCLRDYGGFIADYNSFRASVDLRFFDDIVKRVTAKHFPDFTQRKVFCIGLSRTGTTSLHEATQLLGFRSAHFFNPITCTPLADDDFYFFDAFSDTPVCVSFERLYYRFPNSLFILSTRDGPSWVKSMANLSRLIRRTDNFDLLKQYSLFSSPGFLPQYGLFDYELYYQYKDLEESLTVYNRRVDSFFTAEREPRLLRMDIAAEDNWDRLCTFLSVPKPSVPFPHSNSSHSLTEP